MITLIIGTNRPDSSSRKVGAYLEGVYRELGVELDVLDLADLPSEIFAPSAYAEKPASFQAMSDQVVKSDGLIIVTPEYNGGMPGVLKYFIDMLPFPVSFERRPVCFVGIAAGRWGALRPVEQLQQVFGYRNAHIFPERVFIPGVMDLLGADGSIGDAEITGLIQSQSEGFLKFVKQIEPIGPSKEA